MPLNHGKFTRTSVSTEDDPGVDSSVTFQALTLRCWKENRRWNGKRRRARNCVPSSEQTRGISLLCCHTRACILRHWISALVHRCIGDTTGQTLCPRVHSENVPCTHVIGTSCTCTRAGKYAWKLYADHRRVKNSMTRCASSARALTNVPSSSTTLLENKTSEIGEEFPKWRNFVAASNSTTFMVFRDRGGSVIRRMTRWNACLEWP